MFARIHRQKIAHDQRWSANGLVKIDEIYQDLHVMIVPANGKGEATWNLRVRPFLRTP